VYQIDTRTKETVVLLRKTEIDVKEFVGCTLMGTTLFLSVVIKFSNKIYSIYMLDINQQSVQKFTDCENIPLGLASKGSSLFAAFPLGGNVIEYDILTKTQRNIFNIDNPKGPGSIVVSGNELYVSNTGNLGIPGFLTKIDLETRTVEDNFIPFSEGNPNGISLAGTKIYSTDNYTNQLYQIDLTTQTMSVFWNLPEDTLTSIGSSIVGTEWYVSYQNAQGQNFIARGSLLDPL
jgi:DNA-binding beta-propeller fold protein YncE